MPSASAKIEKIASYEAADPVKQIAQMLEKRVRNLEKRKMKLDNYRLDVSNGKELNEDQKNAVSKYDEVVCLLDFTKELIKGVNAVVFESARQQKKLAKKEQLERQQHEVQRLQEAFFYRHTLARFANEDVRSDFLSGENGAVQLTSEQLSQLDQLHKLIGEGLPPERSDLNHYCHTLAENHIFLVEGKNKEIAGTTYKALKEMLQNIEACGYFSRASEPVQEEEEEEEAASGEETPEEIPEKQESGPEEELREDSENLPDSSNDQPETSDEEKPTPTPVLEVDCPPETLPTVQSRPLQEVLSPQGSFNFLQESQIDLDAPHMDPAVVAVHQIAPPPTVNFSVNAYPPSSPPVEDVQALTNGTDEPEVISPISQASLLPQTPLLSDFDPSHPIPTQTFTNQSFAVMQNMMLPAQGTYITPIAVLPAVTAAPSVMPLRVPGVPTEVINGAELKEEEAQPPVEETEVSEADRNSNGVAYEKGHEKNGYAPTYRGGYRGRGRRGGGGYFRGRPNYNRGGYQNHYYQDRNNYNSNYRRGNNRGPRGGNGNNRGRGNYRTQAPQQNSPPQHNHPPQPTQQ